MILVRTNHPCLRVECHMSCRMVSCLSGVYLLSFCFTGLYNGCSITSLGIPDISNISHAKTSRLSRRKVMSATSYLASRHVLIRSFLFRLLGQPGSLCHQPPSCHPPADRWATDWMMRQHMCLSLLKEVEGCRRSVAWALAI
jgi:hypothetical protein